MEKILEYSPCLNRFVDGNGIVIHDINSLFDNWQIQQWENTALVGQSTLLTAKTGEVVRLICLTEEEENDLFDFLGFQESFGVKTDRLYY